MISLNLQLQRAPPAGAAQRPAAVGTGVKPLDGQLRALQLEMDSHKLRIAMDAGRASLEAETRKRVRQMLARYPHRANTVRSYHATSQRTTKYNNTTHHTVHPHLILRRKLSPN